jgi:photosystem II stability/assembly factor-like uncharacterized protein
MAKNLEVFARLRNGRNAWVAILFLLLQTQASLHAQTWTSNNTPTFSWSSVVSSANGARLAAVAFATTVHTSPDGGATWNATSSPTNNWTSVASSADGSVLIAAYGFSYVSTNAGETWRFASGGDRVACSGDGQIQFSLLNAGILTVSTNKGDNWNPAARLPSQSPSPQWSAIACSANASRIVAIAGSGALYASSDLGKTWTSNSVPSAYWSSLACSADGTKWAVAGGAANGPRGPIYFSTDSGTNWNPAEAPITNWVGLCASADGRNMFALTASDGPLNDQNGLYRSTNFGANWIRLSGPTPWWSDIAASADGGRLVVAAIGPIYTAQFIQPPKLDIHSTNNSVNLSWIIPSANFVLQETFDLAGGNWTEVNDTPSFDSAILRQSVTEPATASNRFYRMTLVP